jgi:steroid 5-alpha reductase family enzyme
LIETWWGLALLVVVLSAAAMTVTALVARRLGRVNVVDVTWGLALALVALAMAVAGTATPWRRWLLAALVVAWGGRLSRHLLARSRGGGEDPRYAALLDGGGFAVAVRKVFVTQGLVVCVIALPLVAAARRDLAVWPPVVVGVVVWGVGVVFETVGDAQLAAYRRDPGRGRVLDRGLWAWTRHPNYFGDACVWWGVWLVGGASSGWLAALLTLPSPLAMTWFLRNVTGAKLLEQSMSSRPGWDEYAARVPLFVPRPPLWRTRSRRGSP